jgi:hypothetical protein
VGTTPSGLTQTVQVTQTSTEAEQATIASVETTLSGPGGSRPSPTTQLSVTLPTGMTRDTDLFPTCAREDLERLGPSGCPAGSGIGTGVAVFAAGPPVNEPVNALIRIYNAPNGALLMYVFPDLGPTFVIEGVPAGGGTVAFDIPPVFTIPAAPPAALVSLRFELRAPGYLVNPPFCPATGWTWGFAFTYANGEQLSVPVTIPCTGPPPPEGNRSGTCKALRGLIGDDAFAARFGTNPSGRNALGKCVSAPAPE